MSEETPRPLLSVHVGQRRAAPLGAAAVAEAAAMLGLGAPAQSQLRAVTQELLDAIVHDAFEGQDDIDIELSVEQRPGAMAVVVRDRGAPSEFTYGALPPRVAPLVSLGFADGLEFHHDGVAGNRAILLRGIPYASLAGDEAFGAEAASEAPPELEVGEDGEPVLEVRAMTPEDVIAVARLFYRTYGYTDVSASFVYEPEHFAERVRAGIHRGTIAVHPSGRVIGHTSMTVEEPGARTGLFGLLAVEAAYRKHHIGRKLLLAHVMRLIQEGVIGGYSQAVTVHTGSQKLALQSGNHEVGLLLGAQVPGLEFHGIDAQPDTRKALLMLFGRLGEPEPRTVHVPPAYKEVTRRIYEQSELPRTIESGFDRLPDGVPALSRFRVALRHDTSIATITVEEYGRDFTAALQRQLHQIALDRFALVALILPLSLPLTGHYGGGLQPLGLSFCGIYPEFDRTGDVLVLQGLNVEPDVESIQLASEFGEWIRDFVVADYRATLDHAERRARSRAHMARIYEAL